MKTIKNNLAGILCVLTAVIFIFTFGVFPTLAVRYGNINSQGTLTVNKASGETGWLEGIAVMPTRTDSDTKYYEVTCASVDYSTLVDTGNRIRTKQNGVWTYSILVKNWLVGSDTVFGLYTGSDTADSIGDTGVSAITDIDYSRTKFPAGFPQDPDHWTETYTNSSNASASGTNAATWYPAGSGTEQLDVPPGRWHLSYNGTALIYTNAGDLDGVVIISLSTSTSSESNDRWNVSQRGSYDLGSGYRYQSVSAQKTFLVDLAEYDKYYILIRYEADNTTAQSLQLVGAENLTTISALSAYY